MENIIYNELVIRRCAVDIGIVYSSETVNGKQKRTAKEIDFIAAKGGRKVYVQSAFAMDDDEKSKKERRPLSLAGDSFPKIIVRGDIHKRWYDNDGFLNIGILDFLLDDSLI